jgi:hypothetical protein
MEGFARGTEAGQLGVDRGAAAPRPRLVLEHQHRRRLAQAHAGAPGRKRPARLEIDQAERVEAAERQPAEDVGAARHGRVHLAAPDGVSGIADGDRARRAGGDDARAAPVQAEPLGDDVDRRAGVVVEDL